MLNYSDHLKAVLYPDSFLEVMENVEKHDPEHNALSRMS